MIDLNNYEKLSTTVRQVLQKVHFYRGVISLRKQLVYSENMGRLIATAPLRMGIPVIISSNLKLIFFYDIDLMYFHLCNQFEQDYSLSVLDCLSCLL